MSLYAKYHEKVQISAGLSCGCRQRKGQPLRMIEAFPYPGSVVICDHCDEYAVVTRVSCYLADERGAIERLLQDAGIDPMTAEYVAAVQAP